MVPRFTVIQGGLSERTTAEPAPDPVGFAGREVAIALLERAAAEAVDRALRARSTALRGPIRLVGAVEPLRAARPIRRATAAGGSVRPRAIPFGSLIGVRPAGWDASVAGTHALAEPGAVREAEAGAHVIEACAPRQPSAGDPNGTPLIRMVNRVFGRRAPLRSGFLRRAGAIIAGTFHRVNGAAAMPSRRARA